MKEAVPKKKYPKRKTLDKGVGLFSVNFNGI